MTHARISISLWEYCENFEIDNITGGGKYLGDDDLKTNENPFFEIVKKIEDYRTEEQRKNLDEFREEVLSKMREVDPYDWLDGFELTIRSQVIPDAQDPCYQIVASEIYEAGFEISHMVGPKFIVRHYESARRKGLV